MRRSFIWLGTFFFPASDVSLSLLAFAHAYFVRNSAFGRASRGELFWYDAAGD